MKKSAKSTELSFFEKTAAQVAKASGSSAAIIGAFSVVILWLIAGPFANYSEIWQLWINTGTTIVTFLMVFLIQKSQNKDAMAIQLKLNELVAAHELASNRLVDIENITEDELKVIQKYYSHLSLSAKKEGNLQQSHSIDEADASHMAKKKRNEDARSKLKK